MSVVVRSVPQCVCCRFVYTRVCVCCRFVYTRVCVCCRFVYTTVCVCVLQSADQCVCCCGDYITVFVVARTIPQCLLLQGLYHSVCCCEDYTTVFVVARTIPQCLLLQGLSVTLRAPVSESLSQLKRDQLQKFAQYLISELPQQVCFVTSGTKTVTLH